MLFYILKRLWFSPYKDITLKKTQRRLLAILVFSVSILIAVGAIFSGFEHEINKSFDSTTKEIVLYDNPEAIDKIYNWLNDQSDVSQVQRYGRQIVKVSCEDRHSMALIMAEPKYKHRKALVSPLLLKMLGDCNESIELVSYDLTQLFPIPTTLKLNFTLANNLPNQIPIIVVSKETYEKLGYNTHDDTQWLSFRVPKNKNVVMWLHYAQHFSSRILDMSQWSHDFTKAIFSQKILMWMIMGLMMLSALFQLKHILEDMLNQQKKFWSLMALHGVSQRWISILFSLYIAGLIAFTVCLSIPLGLLIAYSMNPLVGWIETMTGFLILDPQFFITDHIPVLVSWRDILIIECSVCLMATVFTILALRKRNNLDIMEVLRNA